VGGERAQRFFIIEVIRIVGSFFFGLFGRPERTQDPLGDVELPKFLPGLRGLTDILRHNVSRSVQSVINGMYALFGVQEFPGLCIGVDPPLSEEGLGKRLQSFFPGGGSPGFSLGAMGKIEIFQSGKVWGLAKLFFEILCKKFSLGEGFKNGLPAFVEILQRAPEIPDICQIHLIQRVGGLLTVSGDKGNGAAFGKKLHGCPHLVGTEMKLFGYALGIMLFHNFLRPPR
jgi:hypothetical protein